MLISHIYFRVDLKYPNKTIVAPNTKPRTIPSLTFLIRIPTTRPSMIAKINAISPLLILGCFSLFINKVSIQTSLQPLSRRGGFRTLYAKVSTITLKTLRSLPTGGDLERASLFSIQCNNICQ